MIATYKIIREYKYIKQIPKAFGHAKQLKNKEYIRLGLF
jgi:hypothetical protein